MPGEEEEKEEQEPVEEEQEPVEEEEEAPPLDVGKEAVSMMEEDVSVWLKQHAILNSICSESVVEAMRHLRQQMGAAQAAQAPTLAAPAPAEVARGIAANTPNSGGASAKWDRRRVGRTAAAPPFFVVASPTAATPAAGRSISTAGEGGACL